MTLRQPDPNAPHYFPRCCCCCCIGQGRRELLPLCCDLAPTLGQAARDDVAAALCAQACQEAVPTLAHLHHALHRSGTGGCSRLQTSEQCQEAGKNTHSTFSMLGKHILLQAKRAAWRALWVHGCAPSCSAGRCAWCCTAGQAVRARYRARPPRRRRRRARWRCSHSRGWAQRPPALHANRPGPAKCSHFSCRLCPFVALAAPDNKPAPGPQTVGAKCKRAPACLLAGWLEEQCRQATSRGRKLTEILSSFYTALSLPAQTKSTASPAGSAARSQA